MRREFRRSCAVVIGLALISLLFVAADKPAASTITFTKDVAPILFKSCAECHRPGEIGPMSLMSYQEARPWAKAIRERIVDRSMPPWSADPNHGEWANDPRLSQKDIDTIVAWVNAGAPKGDDKEMPPAPKFSDGWTIGKPDVVIEMPEEYTIPADGTVPYLYFTMPTNFTEDKWIQAMEIRPGNRSVVHHVIAFYRRPGSNWLVDAKPGVPTPKGSGDSEAGMSDGAIGGYVPGLPAALLPPGRAILLPAGSDIVLQVHYNATGKATTDRTRVGLVYAKRDVVDSFERAYLSDLLAQHHGNVTAAAHQAGMLRSALQRLLRKHDLRSMDFRGGSRPRGSETPS